MKKSLFLAFIIFTGLSNIVHSQTCGNTFTDPAGAAANYANNSNYTVTIYPTNPGDVVTVTFTSFSTEESWDALYVFDGNSAASPQLASSNPAGNVPGGLAGGFWGTTIPGPFTSTSADGSLTFKFRSDLSSNYPGWVSNVTCGPAAACSIPTALSRSAVTSNSVTLNWTQPINPDTTTASTWEVLALPCGSAPPTATSTGVSTTSNTFVVTSLNSLTCYSFYVRAVCSDTESSNWSFPVIATTIYGAPPCGGVFTDIGGLTGNYANNSDSTVTICPALTGDVVTATFTSFSTEAGFDALYVFNGNSIASPQIASTNSGISVPGGLAGGYWGTTIPGPFTASGTTGCLTFRFRSDGSGQNAGWAANVTCAPPLTCSLPTTLTASGITHNSALLNWVQPANPNASVATAWQVLVLPAGSPAPTAASTGFLEASTKPFTLTGIMANTCYTFYVRAVCSPTDITTWVGGYNFCTISAPAVCGGQFFDNGGPNNNYTANADSTTIICPTNAGDAVTVTFTSFNTEATLDALYVFDGNTITAPQISSGNPASNVPGGLSGGFWGTTIPGPFSSSSVDGCLTFRFLSDSTTSRPGWVSNISCEALPSCLRPTNVTINPISANSVTVGWTDNTIVNSWEILALPMDDPAPSSTTSGQVITTNPFTISGLNESVNYRFYVRDNCASGDHSLWTASSRFANDECVGALVVPVGERHCVQTVFASLTGATASVAPLDSTCTGSPDDDVWFRFVASSPTISLAISNITGTTNNLNFAVYTGACNSLTPFYCSPIYVMGTVVNNLNVGTEYYIRVYSSVATPQAVRFGICLTVPSTCETSESICGVNNYSNSTSVVSIGTIGCLATSPNATYFNLKIAESGPVNLSLTQSSVGSSAPNLDVDYAAWGPFTSLSDACSAVSGGQAPGIGVPVTLTTGCSYSISPTEILEIANAQAGQYYIILITNFSNQPGYINVSQSNVNSPDAGSIDCSGIRLNAFLDLNTNGTQDGGEPNFPLGQFHYDVNNGNSHSVISPTGSYILYDQVATNLYNLSYTINSDYNTQYTTPAGFTNVNASLGSMTVYNFPVTSNQNYNDLGITVVPQSVPRAGFTYTVKIVYTNNGTQTIPTGSLTFNNNVGTAITNISQTGTTTITNGFTYSFSNLLPYESRSIIVTISVPSIPNVSLGQLLTDTVSIVPPSGDVVANNNINSSTQAVIGSYDPNDKMEGHGEKIVFSSFTSNDYLEYTIRFENNGTAGALDILVNDILDSQLDETSLVMLATSHNYILDRLNNNLTWKFNNIQLPVSIPDTDIGKGFIKFKIKPKPGFAVGDIIPNTAQIYFDSNPAIVTNTFNTEFVLSLGTALFTENSIILYPNPANTLVHVSLQNTIEIIDNIAIYDILGKKIYLTSNVASNQSTIDTSHLSKGIYLVEITTENHLKQIKKLIIQ